jgi:tRNA(Ile)-lysidine synthase TilS/MesJ
MVSQKNSTFEEKILESLSLIREKSIIIACSGGADSMVLLSLVCQFY